MIHIHIFKVFLNSFLHAYLISPVQQHSSQYSHTTKSYMYFGLWKYNSQTYTRHLWKCKKKKKKVLQPAASSNTTILFRFFSCFTMQNSLIFYSLWLDRYRDILGPKSNGEGWTNLFWLQRLLHFLVAARAKLQQQLVMAEQ